MQGPLLFLPDSLADAELTGLAALAADHILPAMRLHSRAEPDKLLSLVLAAAKISSVHGVSFLLSSPRARPGALVQHSPALLALAGGALAVIGLAVLLAA